MKEKYFLDETEHFSIIRVDVASRFILVSFLSAMQKDKLTQSKNRFVEIWR